jgi:methionyl-tRNA formyltransferase
MRIIFFGTPDFAIPALTEIKNSRHELVGIVTAPDKERGRGRQVTFTPVKQFALDNNIICLQPENLKDEKFVPGLKELNADIFVIVAFRILPREVYTIPPKGSFNLHGSLLPKYRGAAPIQWALINGDKETGVTTFFLQDKVDTGNIIIRESIRIDEADNFETLHDKMSLLGAEVITRTLDLIEEGNISTVAQDNSLATPAPKITKELCEIDWNNTAEKIHNLVRGLSPFPGAFFETGGKRYKVYSTRILDSQQMAQGVIIPGEKRIIAGCGKGTIEILEIQPEGRKRMTAEEFLRGHKI